MGRPLKFKSVEELEQACNAYFESCWEEGKQIRPYTITGLALALDTCRQTLLNYEDDEKRKGYLDTIKKAKLKCHNFAEEQLFSGKGPAGPIFNLINNYGWENKQKQEHTGSIIIDGQQFKRKEPD